MELGTEYRIVYKDRDYTKILSGKIISEDIFLIEIIDIKLGNMIIGKGSIISAKKLEVGDKNVRTFDR